MKTKSIFSLIAGMFVIALMVSSFTFNQNTVSISEPSYLMEDTTKTTTEKSSSESSKTEKGCKKTCKKKCSPMP
ncbi:MAG: hypothetical protein JXR34_00980 [Bacteroidales bacterium]|nr:hypothetical protein [Bacteroidales bacterium]